MDGEVEFQAEISGEVGDVGGREKVWLEVYVRQDPPECQDVGKTGILDLSQISVLIEEMDGCLAKMSTAERG